VALGSIQPEEHVLVQVGSHGQHRPEVGRAGHPAKIRRGTLNGKGQGNAALYIRNRLGRFRNRACSRKAELPINNAVLPRIRLLEHFPGQLKLFSGHLFQVIGQTP